MSPLHAAYTFDTLVVGAANRTAVTAAHAVAEAPGRAYNPLFVYARPGLGKTHLMVSIGHEIRRLAPQAQVEYRTLDEFVDAYHEALAAGNAAEFRRHFAGVDALLLDDVQFLGRRHELQAELVRTIDALQAAGKQVVLTSDRPPVEIDALDERLIRRVAGGLVIDIAPPDFETQVAILRRKADERGIAFGPGVLEAVATLGIPSVRELIGALNRLVAFQASSEAPLDVAQARALVGGTPVSVAIGAAEAGAAAGTFEAAMEAKPAVSAERDEFGDFLSELAQTLARQVEPWRTRVGEAILRWEGEGFRTGALARLLELEEVEDPDGALLQFEADAERLLELRAEAEELAPEMATSSALSDPANMMAAEAWMRRVRESVVPPPAPGGGWHLGELAEGPGNRMALTAVAAIVDEPGTRYNPLVVVGGAGSGKTHLLHGLGNALAPRLDGPVACLSAHDFSQELIEAIDRDRVPAWRNRYRRCAALLLDDVHLLAGRERTQEELFLLFNIFVESGRQLAFGSAVPLAGLTGVEARLLTRLEGGLVVELPPPDRELRLAVAERLLAAGGAEPDTEVAAYVASRPAETVRAVQGAVQRVLNAAEAQGARLTAALARDVLEGAPRAVRRPTPRPSPVAAPPASALRSREKMVWEWPDLADALIEEWR
jgi:chromosomal replication initiation ATPase DnaA